MNAQRHLRAVDAETGEVAEDVDVQALVWEVEQLKTDLENAERDLRAKRAQITRLHTDAEKDRKSYSRRDEVEDIFEEWRGTCRHPRAKLTADRFDAIRALLEHEGPEGERYSREHFSLAIAGAAFDPFIARRKNGTVKRFDDIELICRSGKHFEEFACKAPRTPKPPTAGP